MSFAKKNYNEQENWANISLCRGKLQRKGQFNTKVTRVFYKESYNKKVNLARIQRKSFARKTTKKRTIWRENDKSFARKTTMK